MRKARTRTPRPNKSRIAPGPLGIGTLRSCEGSTVFQLSLDPARLSFYCGFCKRIHERVREFKEMECQIACSRRLSELRFDPNRLPCLWGYGPSFDTFSTSAVLATAIIIDRSELWV